MRPGNSSLHIKAKRLITSPPHTHTPRQRICYQANIWNGSLISEPELLNPSDWGWVRDAWVPASVDNSP